MDGKRAEAKEKRGVRIQVLSRFFAVLGIILLLLLSYNLGLVVRDYKALVSDLKFQMQSLSFISVLQNGSDDMTEQSRLFAATTDLEAMNRYFEIVRQNVREAAHDNLVEYFADKGYDDSISKLDIALNESNALMDAEIHSMKLITTALEIDDNTIPDTVRDYALTPDEKALGAEDMFERASVLVNGGEYCRAKAQIDYDIREATTAMSLELEKDMNDGMDKVGGLIILMVVLGGLMALMFVAAFVLINLLVIRPLKIYVKCIEENRTFDFVGSYELKYLALTYNNIFEVNRANRIKAEYKLEHDTLTDASSRLAFEEQKKILSRAQLPIALMVFDVDHFKSINDTYGHDAGDQALVRVVKEARSLLRPDDILARIGGDEFAVVLMNVYSYSAEVISEKLERINTTLQNPCDGSPKLSISAGVAFSEHGYSEELFKRADSALYEAKQNGRCCSHIAREGA